MDKLPLTIHLCRRSDGEFCLEIQCKRSRCRVCEIKFGVNEFADLLTNRQIDTTSEWHGLDKLGLYLEYKDIWIPFPTDDFRYSSSERTPEAITAWLSPYEVDGWEVDRYNLTNQHYIKQRNGVYGFSTMLRRWVKEEPKNDDGTTRI